MKYKTIFIFIILLNIKVYTQITDTLKYYTPYSPELLNTVAFIDDCDNPGWCEPIGVWFTPDSSFQDSNYHYFSIKAVRFCFGWNYKNISFSIYYDKEIPDDSSQVYNQEISINVSDINQNIYNDGVYLFTIYNLEDVQKLKNFETSNLFAAKDVEVN